MESCAIGPMFGVRPSASHWLMPLLDRHRGQFVQNRPDVNRRKIFLGVAVGKGRPGSGSGRERHAGVRNAAAIDEKRKQPETLALSGGGYLIKYPPFVAGSFRRRG